MRQARLLADAGEWSGTVNRGYYAMFYAAIALLVSRGLGTSNHSGVLALLDREFVRTAVLPVEQSGALHRAFGARQQSDYMEFRPATEGLAGEVLREAEGFLRRFAAILSVETRP